MYCYALNRHPDTVTYMYPTVLQLAVGAAVLLVGYNQVRIGLKPAHTSARWSVCSKLLRVLCLPIFVFIFLANGKNKTCLFIVFSTSLLS